MDVLASRANAHIHVIVGLPDETFGWLYAALSEREEDGAPRAPSFYILTLFGLYELYNRFPVLRVVALRVVALWLSSVHRCQLSSGHCDGYRP